MQVSYCLNFTIVSKQSTEDVSNLLTAEEIHKDQLFLSNQTLTSTTKARLETEHTTNTEGIYVGCQHLVTNIKYFVCSLSH